MRARVRVRMCVDVLLIYTHAYCAAVEGCWSLLAHNMKVCMSAYVLVSLDTNMHSVGPTVAQSLSCPRTFHRGGAHPVLWRQGGGTAASIQVHCPS